MTNRTALHPNPFAHLTNAAIERAVDRWITPPENQGQMVETSFGSDCAGTYFRRTMDRSDRSISYSAADSSDCGCAEQCSCFDPVNSAPRGFRWFRVPN